VTFVLRRIGFGLLAALLLASSACRDEPELITRQTVVWRPLGSWSGEGNGQTGSFTSDTGSLRVRWETSNEEAPDTGTFRLTLHSAISGRPLLPAADHRGVGEGTAYLEEDPRVFYLVVESDRLDWTVAVDEGIPATVTEPAPASQSH
jgi:hypothetical protein